MEDAAKRAGIQCVKDALAFGAGFASGMSTSNHKGVAIEHFGEDELYFGSKRVFLRRVAGEASSFDLASWRTAKEPSAVKRVVERGKPVGMKNDILVPAIPALDFVENDGAKHNASVDKWPAALRQPLIKVGKNIPPSSIKNEQGIIKSFASGVRSAVVRVGDEWYRLKGSGNNDEGFVVKTEIDAGTGKLTRQIRGCAWKHTAVRENFMTAHLAKTLEKKGIFGANESFGMYRYGPPNQPFGSAISVPACIVERTRGDRRMGTHVMAGLSLLMPRLLDESRMQTSELKSIFPKKRLELESGSDPVVTTAALMTDHMLAVEMSAANLLPPGQSGLSFDVPRDATVLADGAAASLPHRKLSVGDYPQQWERGGSKPMDASWRRLWDALVSEYNRKLPNVGTKSVLGYLYSRLGSDCGKIMRGMHDMRVSWGTYQDALCVADSQWHCNAHANNVVVLADASKRTMFLGYLDLDMAFDDETYVSVYGKGSKKGTVGIEKATHDTLMRREHVNFLEVLAGADASSGVPMVAKATVRKQPDEIRMAKHVLRDGLVLGYLHEYYGHDAMRHPVAKYDADLHELSAILIKLSIIVMADYIA